MFLAVLVIIVALVFLIRGYDVRLVLFAAGLALCCIPVWVEPHPGWGYWQRPAPFRIFDAFLKFMGDTDYVGPICTALAFSSVLSVTGCDREMVRLLMKPLRRVPWALVPGGCLVGFLTNSAITSQTGSAAAVGPILVPLLLAAGIPPIMAGATLVLGCSGGGNLLNMAEPDFVAIKNSTGVEPAAVLRAMALPEIVSFLVAVTVLTAWAWKMRVEPPAPETAIAEDVPINLVKALLPPLPVIILMALILDIPVQPWVWVRARYPGGFPVSHAMILCTMIALLVTRKDISVQTRAFFEGMGKAYANIISLIITGRCFVEGITAVGMIVALIRIVSGRGLLGRFLSMTFPWILAVVSGSGIAPCVSFCKAVLPEVAKLDQSAALNLGVLAAVASNFGRTMSPVAAVVLFASTLVRVSPIEIVRRTAPPLLAGGVVLFFLMLFC
ncbi:MAG TPA: C4-dicarboxylate transporter DcuC [Planctomycetota bacterium]|nr:C4-dicarboxylate transporter DcuC [Planctomycetota bacterium]